MNVESLPHVEPLKPASSNGALRILERWNFTLPRTRGTRLFLGRVAVIESVAVALLDVINVANL